MKITLCRLVKGLTDFSVERSAYWAVDPGDEGKMTSRQDDKSQTTCIFNNTAVRISPNR